MSEYIKKKIKNMFRNMPREYAIRLIEELLFELRFENNSSRSSMLQQNNNHHKQSW
jgi:hypothetical protein